MLWSRRVWSVAAIVATAIVGSRESLAQAPQVSAGTNDAAAAVSAVGMVDFSKLGLTTGTLFQLQVDTAPGKALDVMIPIPGELPLDIKLDPYSVRGENFKLFEMKTGVQVEVDPGPVNTLRGQVRKDANSLVAGGVMPDGLSMRIDLGDGRTFWVEPVNSRVPGLLPNTYVLYTPQDLIQGRGTCGTTEELHGVHNPGTGTGQTRALTRYTAEVALECDWEYYNFYGSASLVNARMSLIYNIVNVQYERDVDIRHVIVNVIVNNQNVATQDPYDQADLNSMLTQMRAYWNLLRAGIPRDIAHMFTGKPTGTTIGLAYTGVVCDSLSSGGGYGISQPEWNSFNLASATDLVAHETGHNWNACHCACTSPAYTMNPNILGINRFGTTADTCGTNSIAAIVAHRNSRGCLTTTGLITDPPPNDACAAAVAIGPGTWPFSNVGASTDGPATCALAGADIWYYYVPTYDSTLVVSTCGTFNATGFDSVLTVYSGGCGALTSIACNDDHTGQCTGLRDSYLSFPVTRGTTYYIQLAGYNGATGTGVLNFNNIGGCSVPNDNCANALNVADGTYPFSTVCASTDGTVDTTCDFFGYRQIGSDIWYNYTAQCSGTVIVNTCGSSFDTKIAIYGNTGCSYTSTGNANLAMACNDDSCGTQSSVSFAATSGTSYKIRVGGYNNAQGTGFLNITNATCPLQGNDACANALDASAGGVWTGHLAGATNDNVAAVCGSSTTNKDVWYRYTACSTGTAVFSTCGTHDAPGLNLGMDTVLSVFDGCGGTLLACSDDGVGECGGLDTGVLRDSYISMPVVVGGTYLVRLSNFGTSTPGAFTFRTGFTPSNDGCAGAVPALAGATPFCTFGASDSNIFEACLFGGQPSADVWFSYTAVRSGLVQVTTCDPSTTFDTMIAIYDGACPTGNDQSIACNDDDFSCANTLSSSTAFNAVAGGTYFIRVGAFSGGVHGSGVLTVTDPPAPICPADIDDGSGTGTPDGGVDINDLLFFLAQFEAGATPADLDNGSGLGIPDGGVDINDLLFFLAHFEAGC